MGETDLNYCGDSLGMPSVGWLWNTGGSGLLLCSAYLALGDLGDLSIFDDFIRKLP